MLYQDLAFLVFKKPLVFMNTIWDEEGWQKQEYPLQS